MPYSSMVVRYFALRASRGIPLSSYTCSKVCSKVSFQVAYASAHQSRADMACLQVAKQVAGPQRIRLPGKGRGRHGHCEQQEPYMLSC